MNGIGVLAAKTGKLLLGCLFAPALLLSCATKGVEPKAGPSLHDLIQEIVSSDDGALSHVRELVPSNHQQKISDGLRSVPSLRTTDGFEITSMWLAMGPKGPVRAYSFYVSKEPCFRFDSIVDFTSLATRSAAPIPHPGVQAPSFVWAIALPDGHVLLTPQAEDEDCLAHVGMRRRP